MKIDFKVHAVTPQTVPLTVPYNGATIAATVPCTVVELVAMNPRHGSLMLRFIGDESEEAKEKFVVDKVIGWAL